MHRLAINTLGSSISTGLAFTPGLHATPIAEGKCTLAHDIPEQALLPVHRPPNSCGIASDSACVLSEAPRPTGRSESPVMPKKLVGADSPGISDLPDIATHAEEQPSVKEALPFKIDGGSSHHAVMIPLVAASRSMMRIVG